MNRNETSTPSQSLFKVRLILTSGIIWKSSWNLLRYHLKINCRFVKNVSVHYVNRYPFHNEYDVGSIIMLTWINTFTMNEIWRDMISRVKRYLHRYYLRGYLKLKCRFMKNVSVYYVNRYPFHDEYDVGSIIMLTWINTFTINEICRDVRRILHLNLTLFCNHLIY